MLPYRHKSIMPFIRVRNASGRHLALARGTHLSGNHTWPPQARKVHAALLLNPERLPDWVLGTLPMLDYSTRHEVFVSHSDLAAAVSREVKLGVGENWGRG